MAHRVWLFIQAIIAGSLFGLLWFNSALAQMRQECEIRPEEREEIELTCAYIYTIDPEAEEWVRLRLVDDSHRALGVQFFTIPIDDLIAGITYVNAFSDDARLDTFTGSFNADTSGLLGQTIESAAIHAVNGTLQVRFGDFTLGAWGGFMFTDSLESDARALSTTDLGSLGWFDAFGREGDLWAVLVGQPPKLVFGTNIESTDEATSIHFETFYRFQLSDNVYITPGVFLVTDPGHIFDNDNIVVGTLRTTFRF